jgi:hypothetical protein
MYKSSQSTGKLLYIVHKFYRTLEENKLRVSLLNCSYWRPKKSAPARAAAPIINPKSTGRGVLAPPSVLPVSGSYPANRFLGAWH